ncbi:putative permease; putative multidrug-efflux transporter [Clostridium botulinum C str. Eklund]|nr:putative permease; putative multidrug-efflux transporter [Clostridium botulinum C str. Eklund]NEZ48940.1 MFS transporter [Clostridium botulinum]
MNLKLLKQKDFFLLIFGKLISLLGTGIQEFALSMYVLKITGSGAKFSTVLAVSMIAPILLGPIAGVFVDWLDKKKIIVYCDILSGIIVGIYALFFKTNHGLSLLSIYVLAILLSLISTIFQPAISTVIPSIVKKEELVEANSFNSIVMNVGTILGPILGGMLLGLLGIFPVLIVNSISFILSGISEAFINIPKSNKQNKNISFQLFKRDFKEGIVFIKNKKFIFITISIAIIINFVFTPVFNVAYPYIAKEILGVTDVKVGLLQSIATGAMIVGAMMCGSITKNVRANKCMFISMIVISILMGILALSQSSIYLNLFNTNMVAYMHLAILGFLIIFVVTINNIVLMTTIQKEVPLDMLGRVNTVMSSFAMAAMPLGCIIFGFSIDKVKPCICILVASAIAFCTIIYFKKDLLKLEMKENDAEINADV